MDANPEGCSLGYWKNHADAWGPTGYSPSQRVDSVFASAAAYPDIGSSTLMEALAFKGGRNVESAARLLVKQAVAALLNASHPDVNYPATESQIRFAVTAALLTGDRDRMLSLVKEERDRDNTLECPLN